MRIFISNKLTIVFAGKVGSQRTLCSNFALCEYLNFCVGKERFKLDEDYRIFDVFNSSYDISKPLEVYSARVFSFDESLKNFAIDHLGLDQQQCFGMEDDKNSPSHIEWQDLPEEIRHNHAKRRLSGVEKLPNGFMKASDVLSVVSEEIFRKIDGNCWARGTYRLVEREGKTLSILRNAMWPSEIAMAETVGAKTIRLLKSIDKLDHPLDDFPLGNADITIDNRRYLPETTFKKLRPILEGWFHDL